MIIRKMHKTEMAFLIDVVIWLVFCPVLRFACTMLLKLGLFRASLCLKRIIRQSI